MTTLKVLMVRDRRKTRKDISLPSPHDVHQFMRRRARNLDREYFWTIHLNVRNRVLGVETVSIGSLSETIVHPREVFKGAILSNAASVILVHNHPSGDPMPSPEDISLSRRLVSAGQLMKIEVLDHIVIAGESYSSLKDRGLM